MKIVTSKSKNYEYLYINRSYRGKNGKPTSENYKTLGRVDMLMKELNMTYDEVRAWADQQAAEETRKYEEEREAVMVPYSPIKLIEKDQRRLFNVGYLFLQALMTVLRFDNIVRNIKKRHKFKFDLEAILEDLIFARILEPASKRASYEFCKSLLEPPKYELQDVYRALSVLAEESDYIQAEVYKNSQFLHHRNTSVLYYDCTNYYFEIEQEDELRKYGKSKENRPNPIVGMGLFMDGDGIPLAFDLHPGNQNEQLTLKPLEQKVIRDFGVTNFIYCSDSGLGSENNKLFNDIEGRSFVITQSLKKMKNEDRDACLSPKNFKVPGKKGFIDISTLDETDPEVFNTVYYKEVPYETAKLSQTLIVTYSPKYKAYQKAIRDGQVERAKRMITEGGKLKKNRKNPNDPARFITKTATTENGEVASKEHCELNEDQIKKEEMYDGFYAVVTDIEDDPMEIIAINKNRWQIEECFRIMKTDFDAQPVFMSRADRIKAHFLICFLALLVYRLLQEKLGKKYSCEQLIDTLRDMNVADANGYGYTPVYTRTGITDLLHETFGFRTDTEIIKKAKMRSIIKQTKER